MNENNEVVEFYLCSSSSFEEVRPEMEAIKDRCGENGKLEDIYTDKCCQDRRILTEIFPSLVVQDSSSECTYSGGVLICDDHDSADAACRLLLISRLISLCTVLDENGMVKKLCIISKEDVITDSQICGIFDDFITNTPRFTY
jgi:hypothetical protein